MSHSSPADQTLPLKKIPGDYGYFFLGPIKDRLDYFYNQGKDEFFASKIKKYNSTVIRTNMPPGPFISGSSKVVAVLDSSSFQILFDLSKVEKKNVLDGTYHPSWSFTGGHRTCAYLDPSEPNHATVKSLFISFLASKHSDVLPLFRESLKNLFSNVVAEMGGGKKKKANYNDLSDDMSFDFVFRLFCEGKEPSQTAAGAKGGKLIDKWLKLQLAPLGSLNPPWYLKYIEDLILHTIPLPFFLVKSDYKKLYQTFYENSGDILDKAENLGLSREEACHNLVFVAGFNAYGGMKAFFPALIKWVALAGEKLHRRLRDEVRSAGKSLDDMSLTKSVVYEALRIEPPVPFQYATAKEDLVVQSHDASFEIKKGELIFGYQPFATKDPKVFEKPEEFVGDRFVGRPELLRYVYWSNERETVAPTADNKQCPGRDVVILLGRVLLVEFFRKYDTFTVEIGKLPLGSSVTFTSLTKATSSSG